MYNYNSPSLNTAENLEFILLYIDFISLSITLSVKVQLCLEK